MDHQEESTKRSPKATLSRLRQERERHGWSQNDLAELLGTTQANISRWEKGNTTPGPYFRRKLGQIFGKPLEELGFFQERDEEAESNFIPAQNVPYRRNPFFTGREDILASLYTILRGNKVAALTQAQAISGLGGIGKTQIAVEYAFRYHTHYKAILWVTASSRDVLVADFVKLAALLALPEQDSPDQDIVIRAVKRWLDTHKDWLLILDNVDNLEMVAEFLPMQGTGNILLTTRLQALGPLAQGIVVEKMELEEGVMFLLRRTRVLTPEMPLHEVEPDKQAQAEKIVTDLGGLPLALDQAGAYIEETRCSFISYLDLYQTRRKELLLRRGGLPVDHPEPVATTWSLSFQDIEEKSPAAADLLRLLAFFGPDAIPEEIITGGAAELGPVLQPAVKDFLVMNATIELLLHYSLIGRNAEVNVLSMHRLVQAVLRDGMERAQQRIWAERAMRVINRAFPNVELKTWEQCQRYLPHAQMSATYIEEYGLFLPEAARLLKQAANYLSAHAQYAQAEALLEQALAICKQIFEPDHLANTPILNDLGVLYLTRGKYQLSDPLLQRALEIRKQVLGLEHPDTAASLHNLARLYHAQGAYAQAEELYLQALRIRQTLLKPEHPDFAQSLSNLADLYTSQGKYSRAEELYLQARDRQIAALGLRHPDVARTLNNLALLYRSKGEYEEAEQIYKQVLEIQEQVLAPNHPDTAETINNIARLYRAQGKYSEAEPFYHRAHIIREEVFGPDHPQVAQSLYSLAKLYNSQEKYRQAEELGRQALKIQEKRLGIDHPDVAYTLIMLAKSYQGLNDLGKAEDLYERALHIREHTSGITHPQIALIYNNLAEIYLAQKNYQKAEPLIAKSLVIRTQMLGPDHPYMAYTWSNQGESLFLRGDYIQAKHAFEKALAIREQHLGSNHPRTALTYLSLAKVHMALGENEEAESRYVAVLAIREKALGAGHPAFISVLKSYASLLHLLGKEKEACEAERRVQALTKLQTASINNQS